jgi:hypothetical protein
LRPFIATISACSCRDRPSNPSQYEKSGLGSRPQWAWHDRQGCLGDELKVATKGLISKLQRQQRAASCPAARDAERCEELARAHDCRNGWRLS